MQSINAIIARFRRYNPGQCYNLDAVYDVLAQIPHNITRIPRPIHITGTNGKGSTLSFIAAALRQHGLRVNTYTSPHLTCWTERIIVNNHPISFNLLTQHLQHFATKWPQLSFFEALTLIAFQLFAHSQADFSLIEVGLGGHLDTTNILSNTWCSIITPISEDHMHILGPTLEHVAWNKSGIMRQNTPVILAPQQNDKVMQCLQHEAYERKAIALCYKQEWDVYSSKTCLMHRIHQQHVTKHPFPSLYGAHQFINAGVALTCLKLMQQDESITCTISLSSCNKGLKHTHWPGRLENISTQCRAAGWPKHLSVWCDGAHNISGADVICHYIQNTPACWIIVLGLNSAKDFNAIFQRFSKLPHRIILWDNFDDACSVNCSSLSSCNRHHLYATWSQKEIAKMHSLLPVQCTHVMFCGSLYMIGHLHTLFKKTF